MTVGFFYFQTNKKSTFTCWDGYNLYWNVLYRGWYRIFLSISTRLIRVLKVKYNQLKLLYLIYTDFDTIEYSNSFKTLNIMLCNIQYKKKFTCMLKLSISDLTLNIICLMDRSNDIISWLFWCIRSSSYLSVEWYDSSIKNKFICSHLPFITAFESVRLAD